MIRCLLILALVSNQLLLTGQGEMYLCLGGDGAFCLETDPETCTCCKEGRHKEADHSSTACSCSCTKKQSSAHAEKEKATSTTPTLGAFITDENECGCLHLIIASDRSTPATRAVHSVKLEWNRSLATFSLPDDNPACNRSLQPATNSGFALCKPDLDARSLVMRC